MALISVLVAIGLKLNTLKFSICSSSSLKISDNTLEPPLDTEYAPQYALPSKATPDEVKIRRGFLLTSLKAKEI